jgi:SOS-response transcriptional repressor LexA
MDFAHASDGIRLADIAQADIYPNLEAVFAGRVRHNSDMAFAFDKEAVRKAMEDQGVKQSELAAYMGWPSNSYVSKILSGERQVKADEASKIYARLKLVAGATEPIKTVPIIGLSSAGAWREAIGVPIGTMSIPAAIGSKDAFAIEVKGDSMDLLIEDGGYVLVDPAQTQLYDGKVYLIQNDEFETTVKRYRSNPARFCPMSSNPEHQEFPVGQGQFHVVGRVIWKGGMVD